jgi:hypothetical protein
MVSMAIQSQVCTRESVERKPWTSEARNDVLRFLGLSFGLVSASIFLYCLGPSLGMTLLGVSMVVCAFLRSQIASEEQDGSREEDGGNSATVDSRLRCADPAWLKNPGMPSVTTARPVMRQGA